MKTFSLAQEIASDTRCAQGGMMDRAAVLVVYLEDFRAEVLKAERGRLREAAENVCWFDWSGNDPDAVAAIDELRKIVETDDTPAQD